MTQEEASLSLKDRARPFAFPTIVSLTLHSVPLLSVVTLGLLQPESLPAPFEVELVPSEERKIARVPRLEPPPEAEEAPRIPETKIVAPPDSPKAAPDEARFLSNRDSRAKEETVKRGQEGSAETAVDEPGERHDQNQAKKRAESLDQPAPPEKAPDQAQPRRERRRLPGLESLFARPSDLIEQPGFGIPAPNHGPTPKARRDPREYASLDHPGLWGPPGDRGTLDFLPQIREGKFTLLNTKADLYAPFVRRVGLRVFQLFSRNFRRKIISGSVPQGQEVIEVEAVMDSGGRRLEVRLRRRDGNLASDRVLLATINDQNFFDKNPPAKAVADDGNIHFLFALNASVWISRDRNTGAAHHGARWVFGAGLL